MRKSFHLALRRYLIEGFFAAMLMLATGSLLVVLEHPASLLQGALPYPALRRALMGAATGLVIATMIGSPWGKRSGAHFNPAITLAFWSLGKTKASDVLGYVAAQIAGAWSGMAVLTLFLGEELADPTIKFAATSVGPWGSAWAFTAEFILSFVLMGAILWFSARPKLGPYIPALAGSLIAAFILLEAPVSGMSLNPARTLGSAMAGGGFDSLWLYCLAPTTGMLAAAGLHRAATSHRRHMAAR